MRTLQVSADVYAAIWKLQQPGEGTENEILQRVLSVPVAAEIVPATVEKSPIATNDDGEPSATRADIGLYDRRHKVSFPPNFEIFRNYKGKEYRANAVGGRWRRQDTGETYPSLNLLSVSIGTNENAWFGWWYLDECGEEKLLTFLRNPK